MKTLNNVLLELGQHQWLVRGLIAIVIAVIGIWLARWVARALERVLHRFDVEVILRSFLRNLAYAVGIIVVCIAALDFAGVPTTSLLAVLGAAGLAIDGEDATFVFELVEGEVIKHERVPAARPAHSPKPA